MMCGTPENRILEWRPTVQVCQNSGKKWVLQASTLFFWCFLRHDMRYAGCEIFFWRRVSAFVYWPYESLLRVNCFLCF